MFREDWEELRNQLPIAKWEENPLLTIGLSPAILDLELSNDQLHEFCRRVARILFVLVHPDQNTGDSHETVTKFSDAFNLLNDRKVFDTALREFRVLRRRFKSEKDRIRMLEGRIMALEERLEYFKKSNEREVRGEQRVLHF